MSDKLKFLVLNPSSDLPKLFKKANQLNAKNGPFEAVLLIGNVQAPETTYAEDVTLDQPTFFTHGSSKESDFSILEPIQNLRCLGEMGVYKLSSGITIGYISEETGIDSSLIESTFKDQSIDILISYHWPVKIGNQQKLSLVSDSKVDDLVKLVKPRYHFAVGTKSGRFFENNPFKWENETITRFISLAQEGNPNKEKWAYAFNLPLVNTIETPNNLTENPFYIEDVVEQQEPEPSHGLPSIPNTNKRSQKDEFHSQPRKRRVVLPDKCFFCLSNTNLETHMIISIGDHCYLTIAKGPLTKPKDEMLFSGHAIIIPIAHIPTPRLTETSESTTDKIDILKTPLMREVMKYQISLIKMFKNYFNSSLVFFEINQASSVHYHIQSLPIMTELLENFDVFLQKQVKLNNEKYDRNQKLNFLKIESSSDEDMASMNKIRNSSDHILLTIAYSMEKQVYYICELNNEAPVDLQFPRRVFAHVLKTPKRTYWEKCSQSKQRESKECELFKESFKEFDFTIEQ